MVVSAILPQLQRALDLHQAGRSNEAWTILAPLRQAIDKDAQALRVYALVGQSVGRVDDVVSALKRIAAIEGHPPEILGAIADTYGSAGRHAEAHAHWGQLVARHPAIADGHLNRAIAAADAGLIDEAIAAAREGLQRFPRDPRLLATNAMALKNAGRIDESVTAFETAVAADPHRALTRQNQAVALRAACRFEEACDAFAMAERLGAGGAQFHANWAAAALEAGEVEGAASLYQKAIAEDPAHTESKKALTRLQIEYRGGDDAFLHYEQIALARGTPEAWTDWVRALSDNNRPDIASEVGERGLKVFPNNAGLTAATAFSAGMTGDATAALERFNRLPAAMLDLQQIRIARAQLALRARQPDLAARLAQECTKAEPDGQIAWALLGIAWRMLDDPREQWLCDYDRLVMVNDVLPADGHSGSEEYASEVAAALDPLHVTSAAPGDQTLRGGTQTSGALFSRPEPAIQRFKEAVLATARRAVDALPDDATHPFLRRKSTHLGFSGSWSVRLQGGGFHVQHFHGEGWMSSAYYARLPRPRDRSAMDRHEGWIQFGVPPANFGLDLGPRRVVEPKPGRLVLFPSYFWHGTIPFESGDRLTAAFDYLPL